MNFFRELIFSISRGVLVPVFGYIIPGLYLTKVLSTKKIKNVKDQMKFFQKIFNFLLFFFLKVFLRILINQRSNQSLNVQILIITIEVGFLPCWSKFQANFINLMENSTFLNKIFDN